MISFDIPSIFKCLGGPDGVLDICKRRNPARRPPDPNTPNVWKCRKRISYEWLPTLVCEMLARGHAPHLFAGLPTPAAPAKVAPETRTHAAPDTLESLGL